MVDPRLPCCPLLSPTALCVPPGASLPAASLSLQPPSSPTLWQVVDDLMQAIGKAVIAGTQAIGEAFTVLFEPLLPLLRSVGRYPRDAYQLSRRRPRNTRVQMVQAKRKRLDLPPDGKLLTTWSRKQSYAWRAYEAGYGPQPRIVEGRRALRRMQKQARYGLPHAPRLSTGIVDKLADEVRHDG